MKRSPLPKEFYLDDDVVHLSKALLGKVLATNFGGGLTSGIISETEAYRGPEDRGSHAHSNRRTPRTEVMFQEGGRSYVYLCYGIHHLFNVVTSIEDVPHAVLVRSLIPLEGRQIMANRRHKDPDAKNLTKGPGTVTQALGITTACSGHDLTESPIWIEDRGFVVSSEVIQAGPRIGIDYAGEDALLPWRFIVPENRFKKINA